MSKLQCILLRLNKHLVISTNPAHGNTGVPYRRRSLLPVDNGRGTFWPQNSSFTAWALYSLLRKPSPASPTKGGPWRIRWSPLGPLGSRAMEKISVSEEAENWPANDASEVSKLQTWVEFSELCKLKNTTVLKHQIYVMPFSASENSSVPSLETKYFEVKYLVI